MQQTERSIRGVRLPRAFDLFGLTDAEAKHKRFLMFSVSLGAGLVLMLVLALIPDSSRTPWGDFLIAAGTFLFVQLAAEIRISLRNRQVRRAATRALLAVAVVGGLTAAVLVPGGEQDVAEADSPSTEEIVEFIEENVLEPLAIAGPTGAGATIGAQACGSKCAAGGAVVGAGVGVAINNLETTVETVTSVATTVANAADEAGSFLDNAGGPSDPVQQRDSAVATPNLPNGIEDTPDTSSPQPTCDIGYGTHGRASCSWN